MSDTLYLLLDKNIQTLHPHIYLDATEKVVVKSYI